MLESVLLAVDENENITSEMKQDIKKLIKKFSTIFPTIPLENLKERLKTVQIEKTKRLVNDKWYEYKPMENVLCFNLDVLQNDYNAAHLLMSGLLCMMTAHDNTYGFATEDNNFITFNVGVTEMLSNFIVGNAGENIGGNVADKYEDELIATNIMAEFIGIDTFFEAYFKNNPGLISCKITEFEQGDENYVRCN